MCLDCTSTTLRRIDPSHNTVVLLTSGHHQRIERTLFDIVQGKHGAIQSWDHVKSGKISLLGMSHIDGCRGLFEHIQPCFLTFP